MHVVRLFGSESNEYSVTPTLTDFSGVSLATKTGVFMSQRMQSEIAVYHGFDVAFEPPVACTSGHPVFFRSFYQWPTFRVWTGWLASCGTNWSNVFLSTIRLFYKDSFLNLYLMRSKYESHFHVSLFKIPCCSIECNASTENIRRLVILVRIWCIY